MSYLDSVIQAVRALRVPGSSFSAGVPLTAIKSKLGGDVPTHRLLAALKDGVESGQLSKVGALYKPSPKAKPPAKKKAAKKKATKKKAAKKKAPKKKAPKKKAPKKKAPAKKKAAKKKATTKKKATKKKK